MQPSLRAVNAVAIGASIAACTAAAFMHVMNEGSWTWGIIAGLPTFVVGCWWSRVLHWKRTTTSTGVRWGWIASVPLAALNGALAGGLFLMADSSAEIWSRLGLFIAGLFFGATFGVIFWGPALALVMLAFGLPIARAQQLARKGLMGEDRGEQVVGIAAAVLGVIALLVAHASHPPVYIHVPAPSTAAGVIGALVLHALALLAVVFGTTAAVRASRREAMRRNFVARALAHEEPGFRVDETPQGKVLLRVPEVESYREAAIEEEVFVFDQQAWK